jgi:hypothetical protein
MPSADAKRLVLLRMTHQDQVYVGELAAGGTRMSPPRRLTIDEASNLPTAWTPDSKAVLFSQTAMGRGESSSRESPRTRQSPW